MTGDGGFFAFTMFCMVVVGVCTILAIPAEPSYAGKIRNAATAELEKRERLDDADRSKLGRCRVSRKRAVCRGSTFTLYETEIDDKPGPDSELQYDYRIIVHLPSLEAYSQEVF